MTVDYFSWPDTIAKAKIIQAELKDRVRIVPFEGELGYIGGVDAAFCDKKVLGVACVYKYPEIILIEDAFSIADVPLPYVPGYLSFREGPVIVDALKKLGTRPDVILFDGQGIAHPKGFGIASHIGVIMNIATIGCAKSKLIGEYVEPGSRRGQWSHLKYEGRIVGAVLRTRDNVRPIFVSPGHLIDLKTALEIALGSTLKYRIPEPLRRADRLSKETKKRANR
ncbi:MAG: endonuclease V [Nitrospirota bacterium]